MDPDNRVLLLMKDGDYMESDKLFAKLMGENVEPRRAFIQKHALEVSNLDI